MKVFIALVGLAAVLAMAAANPGVNYLPGVGGSSNGVAASAAASASASSTSSTIGNNGYGIGYPLPIYGGYNHYNNYALFGIGHGLGSYHLGGYGCGYGNCGGFPYFY